MSLWYKVFTMNQRRPNFFSRLIGLLLLCLSSLPLVGHFDHSTRVVVLTFNIRYLNLRDGQNAWPFRQDKVVTTLKFHQVDIAGLQEVLWPQLNDLSRALPEYSWLGVGREDGQKKGEFNPIFYRRDRFEVVDWGTFWLAEKSDFPGEVGWDAACPRIVTWARLRTLAQGREFYFLNTHFDHVGEKARQESARLLKKWLLQRISGKKWPVVLLGDFNSSPEEKTYYILTTSQGDKLSLLDAYHVTRLPIYGSTFTFNGFQDKIFPGQRIDHIFVLNTGPVLRFGILSVRWDGRYTSDHFPVLAEIDLFPSPDTQNDRGQKK